MSMHVPAMLMFALAAATPAQDEAVPVENEPFHQTVLRNDYVQAFRVRLQPGGATQMHIHARDDAAVRLSTATMTAEVLGQPPGPPETMHPGQVSARNNEPTSHTHRVRNVGTTLFDVIDVQILARPEGPAAPAIAAPVAENPQMRVYRHELAPGSTGTAHTHARPFVLVAVAGSEIGTSPATDALEIGAVHWIEAPITHALSNGGSTPGIVVEFELK